MSAQWQPAVAITDEARVTPPIGWWELLRYWGVAVAWMGVISTLSSDAFSASNTSRYIDPLLRYFFPHLSLSQLFFLHTVVRKTAHLAEFFVLGLLLYWASRRGREPRWQVRWMVQSLVIAAIYALLDELHQAFVPSRTPSLVDSGIDFAGAAISQLVPYLRHVLAKTGAVT
ncbi:MAG TPA: VanZ family protein [Candidatus Kryptonia bacterium]|nr:VanZ family protein [Candidatus Kryptonia bacterium]